MDERTFQQFAQDIGTHLVRWKTAPEVNLADLERRTNRTYSTVERAITLYDRTRPPDRAWLVLLDTGMTIHGCPGDMRPGEARPKKQPQWWQFWRQH